MELFEKTIFAKVIFPVAETQHFFYNFNITALTVVIFNNLKGFDGSFSDNGDFVHDNWSFGHESWFQFGQNGTFSWFVNLRWASSVTLRVSVEWGFTDGSSCSVSTGTDILN